MLNADDAVSIAAATATVVPGPPRADASYGVEPSVLRALSEHARRIRAARAEESKRIFTIGKELTYAKRWLRHGHFGAWLKAEFDWTERTAQRYLQAYEVFGKSDIVSDLEPTAIYALSAKSTPAVVREEIVTQLEAGARPRLREVQAAITAARQQERPMRQAQHAAKAWLMGAPEPRDTKVEARKAVTFIVDRLGDDRAEFVALLRSVDPTALARALREIFLDGAHHEAVAVKA